MARIIFFIVLGSILYFVLHFLIRAIPSRTKKIDGRDEPEELVQDPYCQTYVPIQSAIKKKIAGRIFYFCNEECLKNYLEKIANTGKEKIVDKSI